VPLWVRYNPESLGATEERAMRYKNILEAVVRAPLLKLNLLAPSAKGSLTPYCAGQACGLFNPFAVNLWPFPVALPAT
jgi:hypothetical protein